MEFRGLYHVKALNFLHGRYRNRVEFRVYAAYGIGTGLRVDIGTEWNLEQTIAGRMCMN